MVVGLGVMLGKHNLLNTRILITKHNRNPRKFSPFKRRHQTCRSHSLNHSTPPNGGVNCPAPTKPLQSTERFTERQQTDAAAAAEPQSQSATIADFRRPSGRDVGPAALGGGVGHSLDGYFGGFVGHLRGFLAKTGEIYVNGVYLERDVDEKEIVVGGVHTELWCDDR